MCVRCYCLSYCPLRFIYTTDVGPVSVIVTFSLLQQDTCRDGMQPTNDVADLTLLCARLCGLPTDATSQPQATSLAAHVQQLSLRVETLQAISIQGRAASQAELLHGLLAPDAGNAKEVRR